jgi:hypothetical protein
MTASRIARPRGSSNGCGASLVSYAAIQTPDPPDPTRLIYNGLSAAYDYFNARLFDGRLPRCLITLQHIGDGISGYFAPQRFGARDHSEIIDEIALNPLFFRDPAAREIFSTLAHEMCHLEQFHFGTPSERQYLDEEWGIMMERVGLVPSATDAPGGSRTGRFVGEYVVADGPFDRAVGAAPGLGLRYVALWGDCFPLFVCREDAHTRPETGYVCHGCGRRYYGAPAGRLICANCDPDLAEQQPLLCRRC